MENAKDDAEITKSDSKDEASENGEVPSHCKILAVIST